MPNTLLILSGSRHRPHLFVQVLPGLAVFGAR